MTIPQGERIMRHVPKGAVLLQHGNVYMFEVSVESIVSLCADLARDSFDLQTITAFDERTDTGAFRIVYVFGGGDNVFLAPFLRVTNDSFPSITGVLPQSALYERKIHTFFGLCAEGNPDLRPLLLHDDWPEGLYPLRKDFTLSTRPPRAQGSYEFQKVEGEGIYEIPVGPVHAGIIEPGHFRFSVAGEEIVRLEARLGYKHRGVEKLFESHPPEMGVRLAERVAGDSSFTHALGYAEAVEKLGDIEVPAHDRALRVVFSELERIANHLNDIGFILLDTGFSFGGSNGARLRERVMQWHERLSGSRFLRGLIAIGGVTRSIAPALRTELIKDMHLLRKDLDEVVRITEASSTVYNRLAQTGHLSRELALMHGVVGVAGRASGVLHDARIEYPYAAYSLLPFTPALEETGDVRARWNVRVKETRTSLELIEKALALLETPHVYEERTITLRKERVAVSVVEGWRGAIVYTISTDKNGLITRVDVRDPSFLNWSVVGYAATGNIVPDFPLINKSFDLSYAGNDL